jgi:hypothetical protein
MGRCLAGVPFLVAGSLLMHFLWREPLGKADLVNYEIVGAAAAAAGIVYLVAVRGEKRRGGRQ